jgi:hypothetical protein
MACGTQPPPLNCLGSCVLERKEIYVARGGHWATQPENSTLTNGEQRELLEPPRVIVMSEAVDDSWSAEVLEMRGYGVLAKPLDEGEVTRVLVAACPGRRSLWTGTRIEVNAA